MRIESLMSPLECSPDAKISMIRRRMGSHMIWKGFTLPFYR
jgi:hypothetical protein